MTPKAVCTSSGWPLILWCDLTWAGRPSTEFRPAQCRAMFLWIIPGQIWMISLISVDFMQICLMLINCRQSFSAIRVIAIEQISHKSTAEIYSIFAHSYHKRLSISLRFCNKKLRESRTSSCKFQKLTSVCKELKLHA